jgi:hypothetical protein
MLFIEGHYRQTIPDMKNVVCDSGDFIAGGPF